MFTLKFLYNVMIALVLTSLHGVVRGSSRQVVQVNDNSGSFLTKLSMPVVLGVGGFGAHKLSLALSQGWPVQSWQNILLPATALAASSLWLSDAQASLRKHLDPEHKSLLSQWWLPAAGAFGSIALFNIYKNNLLLSLVCGAALSAPAAFFAWRLMQNEKGVVKRVTGDFTDELQRILRENENNLSKGPQAIKDSDVNNLRGLLNFLKNDYTHYAGVGSILSSYNQDEILNLIKTGDVSNNEQIERFIQDAQQAWNDEQVSSGLTSIEILQNILDANRDILTNGVGKISDEDVAKLLIVFRALQRKKEHEEVGAVLSNYNSNQIKNLAAIMHFNLEASQYEKFKKFIEDAQQAWENTQNISSEASYAGRL